MMTFNVLVISPLQCLPAPVLLPTHSSSQVQCTGHKPASPGLQTWERSACCWMPSASSPRP